MRTQKEINEAIKTLENYPGLKAMIIPGVDIITVLSRSGIKSLSMDEFRALCLLPLDFAVPDSVRDLFLSKAEEYGVSLLIDSKTKLINVKKII